MSESAEPVYTDSLQGQSAAAGRPGVTVLDQALWRDLTSADDDAVFGEAWLGLTCRSIGGAVSGVLLFASPEGAAPVAAWPAGQKADAGLIAAARAAAEAARGMVTPLSSLGGAMPPTRIAYPVLLDGHAVGAAAFDVAATSVPGGAPGKEPRQAMRQLQWALAWVRDHRRRQQAARHRAAAERTTLALDFLAATLEEATFTSACRVAATELAIRLGCERVSLGMLVRRSARVVSVSHSAHFGRQMRMMRQLAEAMDEAIDQRAVILYPEPDDVALLTRAHAALAEASGGCHVLTIPLLLRDRFIGAAVFERTAASPFDQPVIDLAEAVVAILAPALHDKREIDRVILVKLAHSVRHQLAALFGPMHLGRKVAVLAFVAVIVAAQFARGEYRIAADAAVQGAVQRSLVAPFDGFVTEASVKAGDVVHQGQVVVELDNRDLQLERLRWTTERRQHSDEYDQALSAGKRADAARDQSLIAEADAQIEVVDAQLSRARVAAPFDGLVVSGDLSQNIGAPVRRGDTLFEIAPLDDYNVELWVPEQQVAAVVPGARGRLMVAALPGSQFGFTVERTMPVATARDGRMVFRVDARLDPAAQGSTRRLRPGMEGIGKIDAGRFRFVWIWTRSLFDWVRLTAWQWWP